MVSIVLRIEPFIDKYVKFALKWLNYFNIF